MRLNRLPREGVAVALLALDTAIRLIVGDPYPGATFLLLAVCGISLLPFLPDELGRFSLQLAVLPALAVGSFAILLTTVSLVGVRLTELSIRLAVLGLVALLVSVAGALRRRERAAQEASRWSPKEGLAIAALAGICLLYTSPSPRDRTRSRMPSSA